MPGRSWIGCGLLLAFCAAVQAQDPTQDTAKLWTKRGVYYFSGKQHSPLAGLSSRPDRACQRVTLDDDHSAVAYLPKARKIEFVNKRSYEDETQVGCVLLLGSGVSESGKDVPIGVHLCLYKEDNDFEATIHAHVTVREGIQQATFPTLQVVVDNGEERQVVFTRTLGLRALKNPFSESTLAKVVGLKGVDNLEGKRIAFGKKNARLADGYVEIGHGFVSTGVLRAQLISLDGSQKLPAGTPLAKVFARGSFELRLTSMSDALFPTEKFTRDLFLLGLDHLPLLKTAKEEGLAEGETLVFTFAEGEGTIRLGDQTAEVDDAPEVVRRYLEGDFLGYVITYQMQQRLIEQDEQKAARSK